MIRVAVQGAGAGLAIFGAVVMALGGASRGLVLAFWVVGSLVILGKDLLAAWLLRRQGSGRSL